MRPSIKLVYVMLAALLATPSAPAAAQERARNLGLSFPGTPGPLNTITDVVGVEVGHKTLVSGSHTDGGPVVRTGVTAILPRGRRSTTPVFAAWNTINAAGEMTGTVWLDERGFLDGPILITNTHSVGVVRDAAVEWMVKHGWPARWNTPVVAETFDGVLNDINGFHVRREDALAAIEDARGGPVAEGNVGGGTGMICSRFKGGIGTASRVVQTNAGTYTVGVLVQCNYGARKDLRLGMIPVGQEIKDRLLPCFQGPPPPKAPFQPCGKDVRHDLGADGSIIVVVATDAPLLPNQLKRLAKRPALGLGRLGAVASDGSGDIFIAFSTANSTLTSVQLDKQLTLVAHPNDNLTPLFEGAVDATEEAVANALAAGKTLVGKDGITVFGMPHDEIKRLVAKYRVSPDGRLRR
jgi:L-aminopeptidase/D-esterase-like protein